MEHQRDSGPGGRLVTYADISPQAVLIYAFATLYLAYHASRHYNVTIASLLDGLIKSVATLLPAKLLLSTSQLEKPTTLAHSHANKAASLRKMLGLTGGRIPAPNSLIKRMYTASVSPASDSIRTNAPPGMGNWDNSCYQNSVLQGLSSLGAFRSYLGRWSQDAGTSTVSAMREVTEKLRDPYQNGKQLWTPARLKSMSSLQQQDAQEYYSKIMDELDKDVVRSQKSGIVKDGCEVITKQNIQQALVLPHDPNQNPLEGMLAQQVVCTSCGFSEGLSLIPFNCLTLPLESKSEISLEDCLAEYTKLEPISGVECAKCTLLNTKKELERLVADKREDGQTKAVLQLPPELRAQVMQRLTAVQTALDSDDFSDETLGRTCSIPKSVRVSSTKTRQALLARMPANLVVHINRSVFDEATGNLRKNYAALRYPATLDLGPWILGSPEEITSHSPHLTEPGLPREGLYKYIYRIKAIVTHHGRHENGHYVAYRQAPVFTEDDKLIGKQNLDWTVDRKQRWWRLSDETVSEATEEDILDQGGAFMLFYERVEDADLASHQLSAPLSALALQDQKQLSILSRVEADLANASSRAKVDEQEEILPAVNAAASEASLTEGESEADYEEQPIRVVRQHSPPSPLFMRTANAAIPNDELWNVNRFVAAL